jgi:hypothetical protein
MFLRRCLVLPLVLTTLSATVCFAKSVQEAVTQGLSAPAPEIFAPGEISGPANDGAPTFSPDGNTLFFTRTTAQWTVIVESHKVNGHWSHPMVAPFSGEWPDSSPAMSPDGSYLVFQSTRPKVPLTDATRPKPGEPIPGIVSNLWRVDRVGAGWSEPKRLPDAVNVAGQSIWKPSLAADGTTMDVDPEIAPDGSFLVFVSAGRIPGNTKDHLFVVLKRGEGWGPVTPIRYAGDEKPYGFSTDDEPRLGPDHRTLYFSSDRVVPVHFPRTHEQAQKDLERLDLWDNSNSNVWFIPLSPWLKTEL